MRVEDVDPGEELRRSAAPIQSTARGHDDVGRPLGHRDRDRAVHLRHLVVVDVEARRQAEALGQREAADERAGREARAP